MQLFQAALFNLEGPLEVGQLFELSLNLCFRLKATLHLLVKGLFLLFSFVARVLNLVL